MKYWAMAVQFVEEIMPNIQDNIKEFVLNMGLGMYVKDPDDEAFSPVRWEESPLVKQYVKELEDLINQEAKRIAMECVPNPIEASLSVLGSRDIDMFYGYKMAIKQMKSNIDKL